MEILKVKKPRNFKKAIYRFSVDCGRNGELMGIFVAEQRAIKKLIGQNIWFQDCLGKHSEINVEFTLENNYVQMVTDDVTAIAMFEKYEMATGYNPLNFI
jgi:hypothetical protein